MRIDIITIFPEFFESSLTKTDPAILDAVKKEYYRQNDQIELIASENIVSSDSISRSTKH